MANDLNTDIVTLTFFGAKEKQLCEDVLIYSKQLGACSSPSDYYAFYVPKNFYTDCASVPRIFWALLSPTDWNILVPSLAHDYLYSLADNRSPVVLYKYNKINKAVAFFGTTTVDHKTADLLFREKMKDFGAGFLTRWLAYFAVRLYSTLYK